MVEWIKLGELCRIRTGKLNANQRVDDGQYPFFTCDINPYRIDTYDFDGESILVSGNGNVGHLNYYVGKFNAYQRTYVLLQFEYVSGRYLFHYLESFFKAYIWSKLKKGSVPYITLPLLSDFLIPIPSITEQSRIVGILDTFTASIENLKQQIAQRRKQYEHYRDQLLDLEGKEGVEMKTLGEIVASNCSLSYGIVQPGDDIINGIPVVRPVDLITTYVKLDGLKRTTIQISNSYKRTILEGNEILFCVRGTTGIMGLATNELKGCNVTRGIVPISFDDETTKKFVYYQLKSYRLQKTIEEKTNGTALRQINIKDLRLLNLRMPSLTDQQRIVSILDTFEASIANLEQQLAQRERQYEYYRNKLLTFE